MSDDGPVTMEVDQSDQSITSITSFSSFCIQFLNPSRVDTKYNFEVQHDADDEHKKSIDMNGVVGNVSFAFPFGLHELSFALPNSKFVSSGSSSNALKRTPYEQAFLVSGRTEPSLVRSKEVVPPHG